MHLQEVGWKGVVDWIHSAQKLCEQSNECRKFLD